MPAWDNVSLPPPPSLVPPKADFSALGEIIPSYYQGKEQARQEALRTAFKGGLPTDPNTGQVDYKAAANRLFQLGDFAGGTNLLNFVGGQQALEAGAGVKSPYDTAGGTGTASPMQSQPAQPPSQSAGPSVPVRNYGGADTTVYPGQNIPENMSTAEAQANLLKTGQVVPGAAQAAPSMAPQPVPAGGDPNAPIVPRPVQTVQGQMVRPSPAGPVLSPANAALAPRLEQAAQAPPGRVAAAASMVQGADKANPLGFVIRANEAADRIDKSVAAAKLFGRDTSALEKISAGYRANAMKVLDALAPTEAQKDVASGALEEKGRIDARVKRSEAQYGGIGATAKQYLTDGKKFVQLATSVLNQPETYTGFGAGPIQDFRKFTSIIGDTKGAQYGEALQKISAASVLSSINNTKFEAGEAGNNAGRIFAQQVALAEKTAIQQEGTLAGMRFLAKVQERTGDFSVHLHQMARDYYTKHGKLDEGFDSQVEDDLNKHPIFTQQELQNPSLIGAPTSPYNDVGQMKTWAQKMGLRPGDAVRSPTGRLTHVPPFGGQ